MSTDLQQEFERFIQFGGLLNAQMRKYIVQYLQNKFDPTAHLIPELNDRYYRYFTKALDDIFLIDGLTELTQANPKIRQRIILDTLQWLRKAYKKSRQKNPYEQELKTLEGWAVTPLKHFVKRWGALAPYLKALYHRSELDTAFFEEKFAKLIRNQLLPDISKERQDEIELLFHDLLAQWDALLHAKILEVQLSKLEEEREQFVELMESKVQEYQRVQKILNPFSDYLGWDLSRNLWQESAFDILQHYDDLLQNEQSIQELADLLGSMREAEIQMEEETLEKTIIRQEWVTDEQSRAEVVGIHQSDELSNMLSSEASLLSEDETELLFLKRYADKKLLTFRYEDKKLVKSEDHVTEINQRVHQKEKGPFIICVDTSESMHGRPEQIAKVLSLGILKMAMHQNRKAYLINFSIGIQTLDLYDIAESLSEIASFLQKSFYGGTDATLALYEALRQLGQHDYEDADVLVVSDFIMHKIRDDVFQQIKHYQQNRGTQFHCLTLGDYANTDMLEFFDTNWVYDPKQKGIIRSLTRDLADIGQR